MSTLSDLFFLKECVLSINLFKYFAMKALELSNYGVQEMNATDVLCVNGGMDGNEFCLSPELHEKVVKKP